MSVAISSSHNPLATPFIYEPTFLALTLLRVDMSVCLSMCPGLYNEILTWPFQGVIEEHLLGQGNISKPYKQLIVTNNNNSECFKKPIPTASNTAVTILYFFSLDELMNSESPCLKSHKYMYAPLSN